MHNFENENFKIPEEQIPSKDINLESKEKSRLTKEELKDNNKNIVNEEKIKEQGNEEISKILASLNIKKRMEIVNGIGEEGVEKESTQKNFKKFLELNGKEMRGCTLDNDFVDYVVKDMNLSEEAEVELKEYIDNKCKQLAGLDNLNETSIWIYEKNREDRRRAKLTPEERFTEDIGEANSPVEINELLKDKDSIEGSSQNFKPEDIMKIMKDMVNPNTEVKISNMTRTFGLRNKMIDLIEDRIPKRNSIDDLRGFLNKLDNLEEDSRNTILGMLKDIENNKYVDPWLVSKIDCGYAREAIRIMIKRANEIQGLSEPRRRRKSPDNIIHTDKGDIRGELIQGGRGYSGIAQTPYGKIKINKVL